MWIVQCNQLCPMTIFKEVIHFSLTLIYHNVFRFKIYVFTRNLRSWHLRRQKTIFFKSPNSLKSFLKRRWTSTNMNTYICLIYKSQLSDLMISNTRQNKMLYYLINSLLSDWLKSNMLDNVHLHVTYLYDVNISFDFPYIATISFYHFCHPMNLHVFYCLAVT